MRLLRNGQPVAEGLLHIQPFGPNQGNFFLGRPAIPGALRTPIFAARCSKTPIATTDVNEVVTRSEAHNVTTLINCCRLLARAHARSWSVLR